MVMTDPIADMLTRIRNASSVKHDKLELPASKMKKEIADILKREGFVRDYEYVEDNKQGILRIFLKIMRDKKLNDTNLAKSTESQSLNNVILS